MDTAIQQLQFNDTIIHLIPFNGQPCFLASEVASALGYRKPKDFTAKIRGAWKGEFLEGDYVAVSGSDLLEIKEAFEVDGDSPSTSPINRYTRHILLLTKSGVNLACIKAQTKHGVSFRRWLVDEVLPAIQETGSYTLPKVTKREAEPVPRDLRQAEVCFRIIEGLHSKQIITSGEYGKEAIRALEAAKGQTCPDLWDALDRFDIEGPVKSVRALPKPSPIPLSPQGELPFAAENEDVELVDFDNLPTPQTPKMPLRSPDMMHTEESPALDDGEDTQPAA